MQLEYSIRRSTRRKKISITVERDRSVVVHAPINTPQERIEELVEAKRQWIYEKVNHPQKYQDLPHPPGKELVDGESALYLGKQYRIQLVDDTNGKVHLEQRFFVPRIKQEARLEALREWYVEQAREKIIPRVRHYAQQLGADVADIKILNIRYRWGSCTTKDNVTFNWRLIKAPMFVIDYVIVHELAHLLEGDHTPRFWNIVRSQLTTVEKAKVWLQENGQLLEDAI